MINRPRILITIAMLYVSIALACDPLAYKIVDMNFISVFGSSLLFPMLYTFVDIIAEIYGEKIARFTVYVHTICDMIFTYIIIFIIHLPSPEWFEKQTAFEIVFDPMSRLYIAGVIGTISSSIINIYLLTKWKNMYSGKYFWARSFFATSIGILAYTVITDTIAFYNIKNNINLIITNIVTNICFAGIYGLIASPCVRFLKFLVSQNEDNSHDYYNPYQYINLKNKKDF